MTFHSRWTRRAGVLAALAAAAAFAAPASAGAAPARSADTASYSHTGFLNAALGLPTDRNLVIESVTYDRFQWLLKQPGKLAFLVGDPATDPSFAARAQDVEAAAETAGVKRVYWFNPNLSGNAQVGTITEPNLDIRKPDDITKIAAPSRTTYGRVWLNVIAQYLGNGASVTLTGQFTGSARITAATLGTSTVNDYGATAGYSTKVGNTSGGALYDYTSGAAPATVGNSYFFLYDKDNVVTPGGSPAQPQKIVAWTNLNEQATSTAAKAAVTSAIGGSAASILDIDEFSWWKSANNQWQVTSAPAEYQGGTVPNLTDADGADGWRVHQVTYPELVYLLKNDTAKDRVYLFGGTWCPNTRPVLPSVNRYAKANDVTVINFDTILDGSIVGGGNSGSNPLQTRGAAANGGNPNAIPSFIYGDAVTQYLSNLKTQYTPTQSNKITYYPGGDTTLPESSQPRLQVPYLFAHKGQAGDAPYGGITRQWIHTKADGTYTEYMSSWALTNPQPNQLGVSPTDLPREAPIWAEINAALADFTWKTDPATLLPNTAIDTDDAKFLVASDKANVSNTGSVTYSASGAFDAGPAAIPVALAAFDGAAPETNTAAKAALVAAVAASPQDPALIARLKSLIAPWGLAQQRKTKVITVWGNAGDPTTVAGGVAAVHAAEVFFGGLPGGVVTKRTVTADSVQSPAQAQIAIAIANDYGRVPTGNVALVVKQGGTTVAAESKAVASDAASFTLPVLGAGTYDYTLSYAGDDQIAGFTETGTLSVTAAPTVDPPPTDTTPRTNPPVQTPPPGGGTTTIPKPIPLARVKAKVVGKVVKAPTRKKGGTYKVTITAPKGRAAATGKITVTLKKGKTTKKLTGKLSRGVVTVALPKLAKGTWKVTLLWPGDTNYLTASTAGGSVKVTK